MDEIINIMNKVNIPRDYDNNTDVTIFNKLINDIIVIDENFILIYISIFYNSDNDFRSFLNMYDYSNETKTTTFSQIVGGGGDFSIIMLFCMSFIYCLIQIDSIPINYLNSYINLKNTNTDIMRIHKLHDYFDRVYKFQKLKEPLQKIQDSENNKNLFNKLSYIGVTSIEIISHLKILKKNPIFYKIKLLKDIVTNFNKISDKDNKSKIHNNIQFLKNICELSLFTGNALNKHFPIFLQTTITTINYANIFLSLKLIANLNKDVLKNFKSMTILEQEETLQEWYHGGKKYRKKHNATRSKKKRSCSRTRTRYRM